MPNPNDPLLLWLRDLIQTRGLNTAELARRAGLERSRLRRVLSGSESMLVEELMQVSSALELSPTDMGMPQLEELEMPDPRPAPPPPPDSPAVDPYGNHPRQLLEVGFALGCTFYFVASVDALGASGVPQSILDHHRSAGQIVISLDAAYHRDNDPRFHDDGITLTLSFDGLYDCTFPWASIRRVMFDVEADEPVDDEPDSSGPHLRLVT